MLILEAAVGLSWMPEGLEDLALKLEVVPEPCETK